MQRLGRTAVPAPGSQDSPPPSAQGAAQGRPPAQFQSFQVRDLLMPEKVDGSDVKVFQGEALRVLLLLRQRVSRLGPSLGRRGTCSLAWLPPGLFSAACWPGDLHRPFMGHLRPTFGCSWPAESPLHRRVECP